MGQILPAIPGDNAQNKTSEFAGLFKMTGSSGEKIKAADSQSGKNEEDVNNMVPFLQFLNQQMFRVNQYSGADSVKINENDITVEQAISLLQGDGKRDVQNGIIDDLLNETGLLRNGEEAGDVNPLLVTAPEQANPQENVLSENDAIAALTVSTDKELKEKSGNSNNETITINDQNIALNQPAVMTLETGRNNLLQINESPEEAQGKVDNNFQSELEKEAAANNEIRFNMSKEKETELESSENTIRQKINSSENPESLAESIPDRGNVELAGTKEESKSGNNDKTSILPVESEKKDFIAGNNIRQTESEMKESKIGKDNFHISEKQQRLDAMNSSGNKSQTEKAQIIAGEVSDYIKTGQKEKIISSEKDREEISLGSINAAGSGSAGNEKISDVGADRIVSHITQEIKEAVANDSGRVKIALSPPSLGKLEMDVTVRNGKVEVILVADNKDVQQTLSMHIDKLKGGLQNQGLTIDRCDVFMQGNHDEYQQNFGRQNLYQDSGSQQNNGRQAKPEEKVAAGTIISMGPGTTSGISADNISLFA